MQSSSSLETVTVLGRLLATRGVPVFFALLLVDLVAASMSVTAVVDLLAAADAHVLVRFKTGVSAVDAERWADARPGDRIVTLDDRLITSGDDWAAERLKLQPGPHRIRFGRDGAPDFERTAVLEPPTLDVRAAVWGRWVIALLVMLVGAAVFAARPGLLSSWLLLAFTQAAGLMLLSVFVFQRSPDLYLRSAPALLTLAMSFGAHFYSVYPSDFRLLGTRARIAAAYAPCAGIVLLVSLLPSDLVVNRALSAALIVYFASSVVLVVRQLVVARRGRDRTALGKSTAFLVAFILGLFVPVAWDFLRRSFGLGMTVWSSYFNAVPVLFFVGITAWAAVAQNAFAVDRFTSAVVGYALTLFVLGGAFVGVLVGLPLVVGPLVSQSPVVPVVATALCFVAFLPLYQRLKRRLDATFFRAPTDALTLSKLLRELTRSVQTEARDVALQKALASLTAVGAERAELWTLGSTGQAVHRHRLEGTPSTVSRDAVERSGPLLSALATSTGGGVAQLCEHPLPQPAQEELWSLELAMASAVKPHGAVAGFLAAGRKRSGTAWTKAELAYLETVASQAGLALERSREDGAQFGRYRIEKRLGLGAMAEVFLAWQLGPGGFERRVALKRPLPALAEDAASVAMFLDEARLAAQLSHRNIVQVYEVGRVEQTVFMAIEYIDGPSLRLALRRAVMLQKLPGAAVAVAIAQGILAALEHAHHSKDSNGRSLELVHRDVNTNNVLLTSQGETKLADFGIARAASRITSTQTGLVKGTVPFMSPEQARGQPIDLRTDLFAAAVVLYELLTGWRAFPEGPLASTPADLEGAGVAAPLAAVVKKGMAFDKEARFATAGEFLDALKAALEPAPESEVARWLQALGPIDTVPPAAAPAPPAATDAETRTSRVPTPPAQS